ncbi:uncharacterized protein [Battus philenor]|uniref:uncharacterized protein n=1 Tax=Battus philenor TaxID=42288 RepID=UPI0035CFEE27
MTYYWIFITCSWLSGASLQYIKTDGTVEVPESHDFGINYQPLPYSYFNPSRSDNEYANDIPDVQSQFYHNEENEMVDLKRNRRTIEADKSKEAHWQESLSDLDKTAYATDEDRDDNGFIISNISNIEDNAKGFNLDNEIEKKNFSPWGGKRDSPNIEHMWTWKRAAHIREPSMPKRVRFSPWGGKRSGQIVYRTGAKGSKIIFSTSVPEFTRLVTNYSPNNNRLDLRGLQFIPSVDKRHPIKILAVTTKVDEHALREALPYRSFIESIPRGFKHGHTYTDVALKTDGKRKVKFSAWGGKRSPPIIGPIWTPAPQDVKESTLDAILVIRNNPEQTHLITNPQQI